MWTPPTHPTLPDQAGIVRCLEPILGSPEVRITDHLEREKSYSWKAAAQLLGGAYMTRNRIWFQIPSAPAANSYLGLLVSTLDRCGR